MQWPNSYPPGLGKQALKEMQMLAQQAAFFLETDNMETLEYKGIILVRCAIAQNGGTAFVFSIDHLVVRNKDKIRLFANPGTCYFLRKSSAVHFHTHFLSFDFTALFEPVFENGAVFWSCF